MKTNYINPNISKESCEEPVGTQVTDIAKKIDYGTLVKPFKKGKKLKNIQEAIKDPIVDDIKADANIETGSHEEDTLNSLYDRTIKYYICPECGETINNITDWVRRRGGDSVIYCCPKCGAGFEPRELDQMMVFEGDNLDTTYVSDDMKIRSNYKEPEVYEDKISDNSLSKDLVTLDDMVFNSNITKPLFKNINDAMQLSSALGSLAGTLEGKGFISGEDGQAISDRGFAKAIRPTNETMEVTSSDVDKIVDSIKSKTDDSKAIERLNVIESLLKRYLEKVD